MNHILSNIFVNTCLKSVNACNDQHKLQVEMPMFGIAHFIMETQKN